MTKGRPTTTFELTAYVNAEGEYVITAVAPYNGDATAFEHYEEVAGTVALGKAVAELGKFVTPPTKSELKRAKSIAILVSKGMSETDAADIVDALS